MDETKSSEVSKQPGETPSEHQPGQNDPAFAAFYSGPLPPPQSFAAYNDIVPGAGKIILTAFTAQGKHRQKMERKSVNTQVGLQALGMILGWTLSLAVIGVAMYLLFNDKPLEGLGALGVTLLERWYATTRQNPNPPSK